MTDHAQGMTPEEVDGDMDDGEINEEEMEELLDLMQQGMVNPKVLKKLYKALKAGATIGVADPTIDDDYHSGEPGFHDNAKAIMRSHPGERYAFAFSDMVLFNTFLEYVGSQRSPPMNNKEMREEVVVYINDVAESFILGDPSRRTAKGGDSEAGLISLSLVDGMLDFGEAGCVAVSDVQELFDNIQRYLLDESKPVEARTFLQSTVLFIFEWEKSVALPILTGCTKPEVPIRMWDVSAEGTPTLVEPVYMRYGDTGAWSMPLFVEKESMTTLRICVRHNILRFKIYSIEHLMCLLAWLGLLHACEDVDLHRERACVTALHPQRDHKQLRISRFGVVRKRGVRTYGHAAGYSLSATINGVPIQADISWPRRKFKNLNRPEQETFKAEGISDEEAYERLADSRKPPEKLQCGIPVEKREKLGAKTFDLIRSLVKRDDDGYYFLEEGTFDLKTKLGTIRATIKAIK